MYKYNHTLKHRYNPVQKKMATTKFEMSTARSCHHSYFSWSTKNSTKNHLRVSMYHVWMCRLYERWIYHSGGLKQNCSDWSRSWRTRAHSIYLYPFTSSSIIALEVIQWSILCPRSTDSRWPPTSTSVLDFNRVVGKGSTPYTIISYFLH